LPPGDARARPRAPFTTDPPASCRGPGDALEEQSGGPWCEKTGGSSLMAARCASLSSLTVGAIRRADAAARPRLASQSTGFGQARCRAYVAVTPRLLGDRDGDAWNDPRGAKENPRGGEAGGRVKHQQVGQLTLTVAAGSRCGKSPHPAWWTIRCSRTRRGSARCRSAGSKPLLPGPQKPEVTGA
jgi:hypothetical protein